MTTDGPDAPEDVMSHHTPEYAYNFYTRGKLRVFRVDRPAGLGHWDWRCPGPHRLNQPAGCRSHSTHIGALVCALTHIEKVHGEGSHP